MEENPIGVMTWVLGDPYKAVELARAVGVKTMQLGCPPEEYYQGEKRERLLKFIREAGVKVTTIFCGYAGESYESKDAIIETVGFRNPKLRDERLRKTFQISDFAKDLEVNVIGAHVGFVPEDRNDPTYKGMVEIMRKIADRCKQNRQYFSLETGQETAKILLSFIKEVGRDNLRVNFDPANMLFYGSGDPVEALETLKDYVVGVHCKDFKLPKKGEEVTFANFVLFGEGDVGAERFLRKLKEIGYKGPLTIEREVLDLEQQKRDMIRIKATLERIRKEIFQPKK